MFNTSTISSVNDLIQGAGRIIVVVPGDASYDHLCSTSALIRLLKSSGAVVTLVSPESLSGHSQQLPELAGASQSMGNNDLTISFPYVEGSVDKVSYHISDDNSIFHLVIKPESGIEPLDSDQVVFDRSSAQADLVFLVGVHNWEQLDPLYEVHSKFFQDTPTVCLHSFSSNIVPLVLSTEQFSTMSEGLLWIAESVGLRLDAQAATYLLRAIEAGSNHFMSPNIAADTFEAVAKLIRYGGSRSQPGAGTADFSPQGQSVVKAGKLPKKAPAKTELSNKQSNHFSNQMDGVGKSSLQANIQPSMPSVSKS